MSWMPLLLSASLLSCIRSDLTGRWDLCQGDCTASGCCRTRCCYGSAHDRPPFWGSGVSLWHCSPLWKASASTAHLGAGVSLPLPSGAATDPQTLCSELALFWGGGGALSIRARRWDSVAAFQPSPRPQWWSCTVSDGQLGQVGDTGQFSTVWWCKAVRERCRLILPVWWILWHCCNIKFIHNSLLSCISTVCDVYT